MHMARGVSEVSDLQLGLRLLTLALSSEKNEMTEEAQQLITAIQQMEGSLVDERANGQYYLDQDELRVSYPLNRCLMSLREKHGAMSKMHRERFEQVKSEFISIDLRDMC